jgi:hypothetical protein
MHPIGADTNTANLVAAIAASLAALASSMSVIISALALRRTTEETDILTKQSKEVSRPVSIRSSRSRQRYRTVTALIN